MRADTTSSAVRCRASRPTLAGFVSRPESDPVADERAHGERNCQPTQQDDSDDGCPVHALLHRQDELQPLARTTVRWLCRSGVRGSRRSIGLLQVEAAWPGYAPAAGGAETPRGRVVHGKP